MPQDRADGKEQAVGTLEYLQSVVQGLTDKTLTRLVLQGKRTNAEKEGEEDDDAQQQKYNDAYHELLQQVVSLIPDNPQITTLQLQQFPSSSSSMLVEIMTAILTNCTRLQELILHQCRLNATLARTVFGLFSKHGSSLTHLQMLDCSNNPLGPRGAKALASWLSSLGSLSIPLQHLKLHNVQLGHFGAQALHSLPSTLQTLDLSSNAMGYDGLWKLVHGVFSQQQQPESSSSVLPVLRDICLADNQMADDGCLEIANRLPSLPSLTKLDLTKNDIASVGMEGLAAQLQSLVQENHSQNIHAMEQMPMEGGNQFDQESGPSNSLSSSNEGLKILLLGENQIDDTAILPLAKTLRNGGLQELDLHANQISDAGATALAEALLSQQELSQEQPSIVCLQILNLRGNDIGDLGAGAFVEHLDTCVQLQQLQLQDNPKISDARTRILDMLLKHRNLQTQATPKTPTSTTKDRVVAANLSPTVRLLHEEESGPDDVVGKLSAKKANRLRPIEDEEDFEEEEGSSGGEELDEEAIEEGREKLGAYLEHFEAYRRGDAGGSFEDLENLDLPKDYLFYLTCSFDMTHIVSYGAFGELYMTRDDHEDESARDGEEEEEGDASVLPFVVRRMTLGPAGPLQVVRNSVLEELQKIRHDSLAPIVAVTATLKAQLIVYHVPIHALTVREALSDNRKRKALTWKKRIHILHKLADALQYLHSGRSVSCFHGDVQSSNIYMSPDCETVQLTDAMLSRLVATDRRRFASGEVVLGSRSYRCPRYERGTCQYDTTSDIFSFGVVLGELFTGQLQRSKVNKNSRFAHDIYYDFVMSRKDLSIPSDPLLNHLPQQAAQGLIQILVSCMSPTITHRPTASTVTEIIGQMNVG